MDKYSSSARCLWIKAINLRAVVVFYDFDLWFSNISQYKVKNMIKRPNLATRGLAVIGSNDGRILRKCSLLLQMALGSNNMAPKSAIQLIPNDSLHLELVLDFTNTKELSCWFQVKTNTSARLFFGHMFTQLDFTTFTLNWWSLHYRRQNKTNRLTH